MICPNIYAGGIQLPDDALTIIPVFYFMIPPGVSPIVIIIMKSFEIILLSFLLFVTGAYGMRVRSCIAFSRRNNSVPLIDERGYVWFRFNNFNFRISLK
jgi:hypothetical protein